MNLSEDARLIPQVSPGLVQPWSAWLQSGYDRLTAAWAERRQRMREYHELAASSDRELRDLGLSRFDLPAIRNGTYRRD